MINWVQLRFPVLNGERRLGTFPGAWLKFDIGLRCVNRGKSVLKKAVLGTELRWKLSGVRAASLTPFRPLLLHEDGNLLYENGNGIHISSTNCIAVPE